jgi:ribosomal protein L11 methyltransferase
LVRELAEANWAEAWKAHFTPLAVGRRLWVVPAWVDPANLALPAEAVVIRLDPGMAFGTGLHPTTQLCLAALEARVRPGAAVLDVGTGSGILAIGAALLGAGRVVGLDIDPKAVEIAAANAAQSGVAVELRVGSIEAAEGVAAPGAHRFDLVVANLLAGTIIELAEALAARVAPGGALIASGILAEQAGAVGAALAAAGLALADTAVQGDWVALVARRPRRQPGP